MTARDTLTVRMTKTQDPNVPVRIRITATGNASRGHKDDVKLRGPQLAMGGNLVRQGERWVWMPIDG